MLPKCMMRICLCHFLTNVLYRIQVFLYGLWPGLSIGCGFVIGFIQTGLYLRATPGNKVLFPHCSSCLSGFYNFR